MKTMKSPILVAAPDQEIMETVTRERKRPGRNLSLSLSLSRRHLHPLANPSLVVAVKETVKNEERK